MAFAPPIKTQLLTNSYQYHSNNKTNLNQTHNFIHSFNTATLYPVVCVFPYVIVVLLCVAFPWRRNLRGLGNFLRNAVLGVTHFINCAIESSRHKAHPVTPQPHPR